MDAVIRSPAVVGRAAELATVRRVVAAAGTGRGAVLLVCGQAGIGKSRLLAEAAARATDAGLVVLSGRAVQGGGTYRAIAEAVIGWLDAPVVRTSAALRPYRAALNSLVSLTPADGDPSLDRGDAVAGAHSGLVLGEGVLRLLIEVTGRAPGCLLRLEDLHWADDDTLALVEHLAGTVTGLPVLVAVSARDEAPLHAARRLAAAPGVTTLRLQPLGPREVAALAAACRGGRPVSDAEARALFERSEGLPFLVEEMLGAPGQAVPPTLAALVAARSEGLDDSARLVVAGAAVLGPELDWRLLGPVAGVDEAQVLRSLRAAVDAGLLAVDGPGPGAALRWPHVLTRDAVLAGLLPPERAALASRAATVLAARAGPDDEPRAAELYVEAGEPEVAARLLLALARRAVAHGALGSAEQLLARAADVGPGPADVALERVRVLTLVGRAEEALELGAPLLDRLTGDAHAELCLQLARTAVVASRWSDAEAYVERAGRPDDPRSAVLRADAAFGAARTEEAAELAAVAIDRAERAGRGGALRGPRRGGPHDVVHRPGGDDGRLPPGRPGGRRARTDTVAGHRAGRSGYDRGARPR